MKTVAFLLYLAPPARVSESKLLMQRVALPFVSALALTACGLDIQPAPELTAEARETAKAGEAVDDVVSGAAALVTVPLLALDRKQKLLSEVVAAQPNLTRFFAPEGCATIVTEGNDVRFHFEGCSGPWGLARANGDAKASFLPGSEEGGLRVEFATEPGFLLAGQPIAYTTSFDIVQRDAFTKVGWKGTYDGQTRARATLHIEADVRLRLADGCAELDGDIQADVNGRGLVLTYDQLDRCGRDACATGDLKLRGLDDDAPALTLSFDGTRELEVTTKAGAHGTLPLTCNPQGGT